MKNCITRRGMISGSLAGSAILAACGIAPAASDVDSRDDETLDQFQVVNGRIRQSVMGWCFNPMPAVELARHCKTIGLVAIEGIGAQHYDAVRDIGLEILWSVAMGLPADRSTRKTTPNANRNCSTASIWPWRSNRPA